MKKWIKSTSLGQCRDCNIQREVEGLHWNRASKPRCLACDGLMDRVFLRGPKHNPDWHFNSSVDLSKGVKLINENDDQDKNEKKRTSCCSCKKKKD